MFVRVYGYIDAVILGGEKYFVVLNNVKGGFRAVFILGYLLDSMSVIIVIIGGCKIKGLCNVVIVFFGGFLIEVLR